MKQQVFYTYVGTNGTITSSIHLEDIYYIKKILLSAKEGYSLTKDSEHYFSEIMVPENEVGEWKEVKTPSGQNQL